MILGGGDDHVLPPQLDAWGLGPRVPLLIISPFVKRGYVEHQQLEFSSIVRFIEEVYGLPFLTARDKGSADMWDAFDFVNDSAAADGSPAAHLLLPIKAASVIGCDVFRNHRISVW